MKKYWFFGVLTLVLGIGGIPASAEAGLTVTGDSMVRERTATTGDVKIVSPLTPL